MEECISEKEVGFRIYNDNPTLPTNPNRANWNYGKHIFTFFNIYKSDAGGLYVYAWHGTGKHFHEGTILYYPTGEKKINGKPAYIVTGFAGESGCWYVEKLGKLPCKYTDSVKCPDGDMFACGHPLIDLDQYWPEEVDCDTCPNYMPAEPDINVMRCGQ